MARLFRPIRISTIVIFPNQREMQRGQKYSKTRNGAIRNTRIFGHHIHTHPHSQSFIHTHTPTIESTLWCAYKRLHA